MKQKDIMTYLKEYGKVREKFKKNILINYRHGIIEKQDLNENAVILQKIDLINNDFKIIRINIAYYTNH